MPAGVVHGSAIGGRQPVRGGWRERLGLGRFVPLHVPIRLPGAGKPLPRHQVSVRSSAHYCFSLHEPSLSRGQQLLPREQSRISLYR